MVLGFCVWVKEASFSRGAGQCISIWQWQQRQQKVIDRGLEDFVVSGYCQQGNRTQGFDLASGVVIIFFWH